ncbi:hypothetical protein PHMEG_00023572 [Phytophthora megakarya]|uniref:Reverse transcriptase RNase H-like domain-containing protein n=1 Tax=Phytophthora megakarya TaxID=4795 RepID=A0A225VHR7_9STRA|nr:hypothetical protein PHMEG_00023572 [Phytophthora megakarya]
MHPVRFYGRVLKDGEMNYHSAVKEVLALLLLLKICYTQLAGRTIHVYTQYSTLERVHISKSLFGRTTQFAVMLSPWHLVVTRDKEKKYSFAQLLQAGLTGFVDLEDTELVGSFDGSAKTEKYGGYGSCSWIDGDYLTGH